jgi:hypothetical protein
MRTAFSRLAPNHGKTVAARGLAIDPVAIDSVSWGLRRRLVIHGIVQGVGFRPWIHQLAQANLLSGYVLNSTLGVTI